MSTHQEILDFWFGSSNNKFSKQNITGECFQLETNHDRFIKSRFSKYLKSAVSGRYKHWTKRVDSCLALVILLLIISRRLHGISKTTFQNDMKALHVCQKGIVLGYDRKLSLHERLFFYMPMMMSEDLSVQQQSVACYKELAEIALREESELYRYFLLLAIQNYETIKMFGHFPERNEVLQRESTSDEMMFLEQMMAA